MTVTLQPAQQTASRIGLGTAQFGSDYGITNRTGQISDAEAAALLGLAMRSGMNTIDTASLYGDGEQVIGRNWPHRADFQVVTKTPRLVGVVEGAAAAGLLRSSLVNSLEALARPSVYGLLLHDANDLLGPVAGSLWSELERLKASGLVEKIGVSVYDGEQIDAILGRYPIDIIQLPFNALDGRLLLGGQLQRLASAGVEVHARSLFLQGLLLAPVTEIPTRFAPIRSAVEQLDRTFANHDLSRLEGLLAIAFARKDIHRFIIGVTSREELDGVLAAAARVESIGPVEHHIPEIEARYLNPARWHELAQVE